MKKKNQKPFTGKTPHVSCFFANTRKEWKENQTFYDIVHDTEVELIEPMKKFWWSI